MKNVKRKGICLVLTAVMVICAVFTPLIPEGQWLGGKSDKGGYVRNRR